MNNIVGRSRQPRRATPRSGPVELGKHVVADPRICHGKPTFKGTRIMVWQLFEHLALGESVEDFSRHFPGRVSLEAAREALGLGKELFAHPSENLDGLLSRQ